jgi:hypothetical protein
MNQDRADAVLVGLVAPVLALTYLGFAPVVPHAATSAQLPEPRQEPQQEPSSDMVVARGCVLGGAFTVVSPSGVTQNRRTYRLTGSREMIKLLRKEHEGHLEEITGRMQGDFDGPNVVRRKKVGKVAVVVGAGRGGSGAESRVSDTPTMDVSSTKHLDDRCPG